MKHKLASYLAAVMINFVLLWVDGGRTTSASPACCPIGLVRGHQPKMAGIAVGWRSHGQCSFDLAAENRPTLDPFDALSHLFPTTARLNDLQVPVSILN